MNIPYAEVSLVKAHVAVVTENIVTTLQVKVIFSCQLLLLN